MNRSPSRFGPALAATVLGLALAGFAPARAGEGVVVNGITEPIKDLTLAFPMIGVVGTRPLDEGAPIKIGQVVIELDKQLEQLDVERKRLVRELARAEWERVKSLAERNSISVSPEELDKKKAEYDIAKVEHALAEETVARRVILSPIDGYVAQFYRDIGEKCEEQQPVVRVVDTRQCFFVGNVDAAAGRSLRLDQPLTVEIDAGPEPMTVQGVVCYISPVVDPASGLLKFKVLFQNPEGKLRPGVTGRARLH
ncbi:MAG TPA: efflux RND transporter periplasmic adaptor subunit [Verrucomicrobiota bacterium]|nr:efflux RND transporter periplasmic adaptor subunit [Verrucomicrobiota bacterium]HNU50445.1 efflux RND transporter periplasmic adaptor subunit [Verrucomicrobiota bacterium]